MVSPIGPKQSLTNAFNAEYELLRTHDIRNTATTTPDSEKKPVAMDDTVRGDIEDLKQVSRRRSAVTTHSLRENQQTDSAGIVRNKTPGSATRSSTRATPDPLAVMTKELVAITNELDMLKAEYSEHQNQANSAARAKSSTITYLKRGMHEAKNKIEEVEGQIETVEGERDALQKLNSTSTLTTVKRKRKSKALTARLVHQTAKHISYTHITLPTKRHL